MSRKWSLLCTFALLAAIVAGQPESPSFKYSRQANEAAQRQGEADQHSHHGHSHEGHGHSHGGHSHEENHHPDRTFEEQQELWVKAIGSTLLVSLAPFVILFFIPISEKRGNENALKVFLAFASGGLLGDAFLHLIPHAMTPHDGSHAHGHSHEEGHSHDNSVGFSVLAGMIVFLLVEKFVRLVKGGHSHSHSHGSPQEAEPAEKKLQKKEQAKKIKGSKDKAGGDSDRVDEDNHAEGAVSSLKVGAYLNLAADFAHNFTDGLAIGASFLAGNTPGVITTVIILLHEVPHEIGDFALLVQNGMTKRKAMFVQLLTAVGCLAGTILSLTMEEVGAASWVLPFTAGGFIYIATVSVIPELLEKSDFCQSAKEIAALLTGIGLMMILTEFE